MIREKTTSYINATQIRHCLIEHLQTAELYVANDISLGEEKNGILLYGTNAVGKTSFIRAIGICIIMAQAGLFVPAEILATNFLGILIYCLVSISASPFLMTI